MSVAIIFCLILTVARPRVVFPDEYERMVAAKRVTTVQPETDNEVSTMEADNKFAINAPVRCGPGKRMNALGICRQVFG